ncbi:hypothetical protein DBR17_17130 [Sphingomonas sp. HMWF008]|nr:hypothetical protein DBR17_17130 [Sphingomonas sp. HMWF008]
MASAEPREARQFASFLITGGFAAGVNLISRWAMSHVMPYALAIVLAYLLGMTTAYLLARRFVFTTGKAGWRQEFRRFALVNVVSALVVLCISIGLARFVFPALGFAWYAEDVAHLIGVASPIVLSYFAHKHYSFGGARTTT